MLLEQRVNFCDPSGEPAPLCTQRIQIRELALEGHGIYSNNGDPEIICSDNSLLTAVKISDAVSSLDDVE